MNWSDNGKTKKEESEVLVPSKLMQKFKTAHPYKKRGIIYIAVASLFICYELLAVRPLRATVLLLWSGVILIALLVMTQLKDPRQ